MIVDLVTATKQEDWGDVRRVLFDHWKNVCPKIFAPNADQPWEHTNNQTLMNDELFVPLVSTFCADSQNQSPTLCPLNEIAGTSPEQRSGQICGHVFRVNELTYTCRDCAQDVTCVMCFPCFDASIHKNHRHKIHASSGSGYCDCGDADAWSQGYACQNHSPTANDVQLQIPKQLNDRVRSLVEIALHYCIALFTCDQRELLPSLLEAVMPSSDTPLVNQFLTVLYNDETHTYESVIRVLELCIHCTKDQAMLVATIVDHEGRSSVKIGPRAECDRVKADVQRRTQRDVANVRRFNTEKNLPLKVKVMDTVLFAHQTHAIALLNWMCAQIDKFPPLREIVGEVLLNSRLSMSNEQPMPSRSNSSSPSRITVDTGVEDDDENEEMETASRQSTGSVMAEPRDKTLVEVLIEHDTSMWKAARVSIHQILMKTVLINYEQKLQFAKVFMKNYGYIYRKFVEDDHEMDVSVVSLSVQFLTVPTIARRLIAEENALKIVMKTLLEHTDEYVKLVWHPSISEEGVGQRRFDFSARSFTNTQPLRRAITMTRDGGYILNAIPPTAADWTDALRINFLEGCVHFINFLHRIQGMDEVKRQSVEHQTWDSEWESAFNIQLRIKDSISMIVAWAMTDEDVHKKLLFLCLNAMDMHPLTSTEESGGTHVVFSVDEEKTALRSFDVLRGGVSIHHPIVRLTAALFTAPNFIGFLKSSGRTPLETSICDKITVSGKDFYEHSLRVLVLCAQATAQLWRRNGFSLVNQIHNYYSPLCRNEMFDRDVLMMQIGAALTVPKEFLAHLMVRFRISNWADPAFDGNLPGSPYGRVETDELSKITVTLAEECIHLLIMIIGERYVPGVGKVDSLDFLKREVIHVLCTGSQTHSHISHKMSQDAMLEKLSLNDALNAVAEFRKPVATSAGQFFLKKELYPQYNPFFYHYSKSDHSQAEQHQQKIRAQMRMELKACPPPMPPEFCPFFACVPDLLQSHVIIKVMKVVLERTARRNRFSSDRLLQKTLFLIGMGLNEQTRNPKFTFVETAQECCDLLTQIEALNGKQEAFLCQSLLSWVLEKYKSFIVNKGEEAEPSAVNDSSPKTIEDAKAKRAAIAAQSRLNAIKKMNSMQKSFVMKMEAGDKEKDKQDEAKPAGAVVVVSKEEQKESEEDVVVQIPSSVDFPSCMGSKKWRAEVQEERRVKCILCQETESVLVGFQPMVCAAFIQQSQLFTHKSETTAQQSRDQLIAPATLRHGIDTSTCSHTMHYECYRVLADMNRGRDGRSRQQVILNQKMVDPEAGEYQCPLCKRLSNAAMPILPALQISQHKPFSEVSGVSDETFENWVTRLRKVLEMPCGSEVLRKKGHSRKRSHSERSLLDLEKQATAIEKAKEEEATMALVDSVNLDTGLSTSVPSSSAMSVLMSSLSTSPSETGSSDESTNEFYKELAAIWNQDSGIASPVNTPEATPVSGPSPVRTETAERKPFSAIQHALFNLIRPIPALLSSNKLVGPSLESFEDSVKEFGKCLLSFRRRGSDTKAKFLEKHLHAYVTATVTWQSTAHVARAIAAYLQYDKKPLFGALNTRHKDCLSAMARLSAVVSHNMQLLPNAISEMLRIFLCEPPKQKQNQQPTSPINSPLSSNSPTASRSSSVSMPSSFAAFIQLFIPTGSKKQANMNILHVDILSLAFSLMMSIGWTWKNGVQSLQSTASSTKQPRQLVPDGSVDEAHVLRLALTASYFQVMATFNDDDTNVEMIDEPEQTALIPTYERIRKLWTIVRPNEPLSHVHKLYKTLEEGGLVLLRPIALTYHFLTLVDPPEALKDPSIDSTEALFRYMALPMRLEERLHGETIENLFHLWSTAVPRDEFVRRELVVQPIRPNLLIDLPPKYSDLINRVATFKCPSVPFDEPTSNFSAICLVCGQILCSQGYCCQKIINKETFGACRYHMMHCSGSVGVFIRVRDCTIFMMTTRKRGCLRPAPYVDEFGELDQGFRRGNPLHLNEELYHKLKLVWIQQGITEEVVNQCDMDHRNMQFNWAHF